MLINSSKLPVDVACLRIAALGGEMSFANLKTDRQMFQEAAGSILGITAALIYLSMIEHGGFAPEEAEKALHKTVSNALEAGLEGVKGEENDTTH